MQANISAAQVQLQVYTGFHCGAKLNASLTNLKSLDRELYNICKLIPKSKPIFQKFSSIISVNFVTWHNFDAKF